MIRNILARRELLPIFLAITLIFLIGGLVIVAAENATESPTQNEDSVQPPLNETAEISVDDVVSSNADEINSAENQNQIPASNETNSTENENTEDAANQVQTANETNTSNQTSSATNETTIQPPLNEIAETPVDDADSFNSNALQKLDIKIISDLKITRGEKTNITAIITNVGNSAASGLSIQWALPEGFQITSESENCGNIQVNESCKLSAEVQTFLSATPGIDKIKLLIS